MYEENEVSRREHEEQMRLMEAGWPHARPSCAPCRHARTSRTSSSGAREVVLGGAERRANEESAFAAKVREDLRMSNQAHQAEFERMRVAMSRTASNTQSTICISRTT